MTSSTSTTKIHEFFNKQQASDRDPGRWGVGATEYEQTFSSKFEYFAGQALDIFQRDLPQKHFEHLQILDVGCGTGAVAVALKSHPLGKRVDSLRGIDFSAEMIELAKQKPKAGLGGSGASFEVMDGQNLTFHDNTFHAATAMFSLIFFPDRIKGLSEIHRTLKPQGMAVVAGWGTTKEIEWVYFSNKAIKQVLGANDTLPTPPKSYVPNFLSWSDPNVVRAEMQQGGFSNVYCIPVKKRFEFDNPDQIRQLWFNMRKSFPTLSFVVDTISQTPEAESKIADAFAALICERGCSGSPGKCGYVDGTALFGVGSKSS
eukprot:c10463_g1_i1.p1 GENE.c10463_g1_i1~~c10463_g1_i1.p1  ORF type:complete len:364 (+),score=76.45 c10463_g1_i1:145-1092(+)